MRWVALVFAVAAVGCFSAGGGGGGDDAACTEGMQINCGCSDGSMGTQLCGQDAKYGACSCGAAGSSGGASAGGGGGITGAGSGGTSGAVSSGGTSGSAGSPVGGSPSGGSGGETTGCNPVPGPKQGDGLIVVIDELDDTDIMFSTAGVGAGAWDFSKDASSGTITPAGTVSLLPEPGGYSGSALHIQGTGLTGWGAALGAYLNGATSSFDASSYSGIAFYIKGTSTVQEGANMVMVLARMPDVLPGPGSCCSDVVLGSECYSAHRAIIGITSEWSLVTLPWSSFVGPTWGLGATLSFNPNRIRDFTFSFNHDAALVDAGASFDVWIDGLSFM
jgi:hypothetical protein